MITEEQVIERFTKIFKNRFGKDIRISYDTNGEEFLGDIIRAMCCYTGLNLSQLFAKSRVMELIIARRIVIGMTAPKFSNLGILHRQIIRYGYQYDRTTVYNDAEVFGENAANWFEFRTMLDEFLRFYHAWILQGKRPMKIEQSTVFEQIRKARISRIDTKVSIFDHINFLYDDRSATGCDPAGMCADPETVE